MRIAPSVTVNRKYAAVTTAYWRAAALMLARKHGVGEVHHAAGIAGLVVVPRVDFQHRAVGVERARRVHDGAAAVVRIVSGNQWAVLAAENARERPGGGGAEQRVHLRRVGRTCKLEDAVGERGVQHRHTHRMAIETAHELGVDEPDRGGTPGRGRRERKHR